MEETPKLDDFSKRYLIGLLVIALVGLGWWILSWDKQVSQLNTLLQADTVLADYPYQFRVVSLEGGVATISSPRSAQVPVIKFLRIAFPELRNSSVMDEAVMVAQDKLAAVQSRAGKLVSEHKGVESIRWAIDRQWYEAHGSYLN